MEIKKITCQQVAEYICDTLAEDIDAPQCAEIKNHLEHCDNCSKFFKSVQSTIAMYKEWKIDLPEDIHSRLMSHLNLENFDSGSK
jgi:predicted anti-sigma-YlaC factor YlaD